MDTIKVVEVNELMRIYGELLTGRQLEVLNLRFGSDYSLGEIAALLGISRQGVKNFETKALAALYNFEDKLKIMTRVKKLKLEGVWHSTTKVN